MLLTWWKKITVTQVHKLIVLFVDHDELGVDGVWEVLENVHYPNHCINPIIMETQTREVAWTDDHPLNKSHSMVAAFEELFK